MTTLPAPDPIGFDTLLSRSWQVFRRNWIVALPPIIVGVVTIAGAVVAGVIVVVAALANHGLDHPSSRLAVPIVAGYLVFMVLVLVLTLWAYTAMFGMADAAWERGMATFGDGFAAFRTRSGAVIVASIGMFGLALAALILTLGLGLLVFPLAVMYVMPAVVAGGRGGFEAIGESFRLVRRFFVPSLVSILVLIAIWYGISFLGAFAILPLEFAILPRGSETMPRMPPIPLVVASGIGYLVTTVVSTAYTGFFAVALTGLYRDLAPRETASPLPPAPAGIVPSA